MVMETYREVSAFFRERLLQAFTDTGVRASDGTSGYLVHLLSSFVAAERVQDLQTPFVDLLTQAYSTRGSERALRMRGIGDSALFVAGFLVDSMERRGITASYCCTIGQRAYGEAGQQMHDAGTGAAEVFRDLSGRFHAFTRVLDEVREQTTHRTDGELIRVYERWLSSGSPELLRRLGRAGVGPVRDDVLA